jgi:hypothetical protein
LKNFHDSGKGFFHVNRNYVGVHNVRNSQDIGGARGMMFKEGNGFQVI